MYLKKLELFGFKSFATKTELNFEPGVTAIVGPNGCGKCVHRNTFVLLSDGSRRKISELIEDALEHLEVEELDDGFYVPNPSSHLNIFSLNPLTLKLEERPIAAFIKRKAPPYLLYIKTKSGREIISTDYHPFFTIQNGVLKSIEADELKVGIKVACPRHIKIKTNSITKSFYDLISGINTNVKDYIRQNSINIEQIERDYPKIATYYEDAYEPLRVGVKELFMLTENRTLLQESSFDAKRIMLFANSDIYWDEIIKIDKVYGERWVYDLEIEKTHNYIADDFIVHNSNISDAIKWVLGEQSAKELRGSKMEDVIFNGTDETQPVNLAEASLIFSNKDHILPIDYDEVTMTRRAFRSGESEYFINKTQVRLKDVIDLLAGTGIGISSYSIAEQGKIDRVLNAKPEDRREIFEEASGITKYKTKKKEALLKLEHTENNILRIADIISEVRRQITSIERQAQKAERFRIEFEKLKGLDIRLAYHEYKDVKEREGDISKENDTLKQKEAHLSLELNLQADELRLHREKVTSLDEKFTETRLKVSNILASIDKNENIIRIDKERIEELSQRIQSLTKEIEEIARRISELQNKLIGVESEFNLINDEREKRQFLIGETEKGLESIINTIKECQKAISEVKFTLIDNLSNQSRIRNELNKIITNLNTSSSRFRRLNIEKDTIGRERLALEKRSDAAQGAFSEQRAILEKAKEELNRLNIEYEALNRAFQEKSNFIELLKRQLASSGSKLELLKDLKEKKEGFSDGVKAYMNYIENNAEAKESFIGPIADMFKPKRGYSLALESALGEMCQIIVVKTQKAALEALEYLKNNKLGRAHFIDMEGVLSFESEPRDGILPHGISNLSDFVEADDSSIKLLRYLLKDTYVVKDINTDPAYRRCNQVFVTKEGDIIDGMLTTGGYGSQEDYTSIIGRDAKIRELSNEIEQLNKNIRDSESEQSEIGIRLNGLKAQIQVMEDAAKREEIKLNLKGTELAAISEEKDKLKREFDIANIELEEIIGEEKSLRQQEQHLKEELVKLEQGHQKSEVIINERQDTIVLKSSEKEKVIVALTELRTQMILVNDRYSSQETALNMLKNSIRDEEAAANIRRVQLNEAENKISSLECEMERLSEENRILSSQRQIICEELTRLAEEKKAAHVVVEDADSRVGNKQKELDELRSNISTYHINITEFDYKANSIKERIQQAYKVNLDEEHIVSSPDEDWDKIAQEVSELKDRIEKIGPVNLVAIEEHKELQERYEFLMNQQQDLINAKESLHKAINKINRTTRAMFIETFEQIKVAFKDYFKLLFGGGQAELFLLDQTDILESGIEIVVRPPGKKLQSISLLSGGEKALTTTALLFALFKVKPTPFCILDEIDAPLDEANIDRFSRILQEFVKTTQFIIITHNKKTIAISDIMYGITMEKTGISKIVSVKFAESHKQAKERERNLRASQIRTESEELKVEEISAEPVTDESASP